MIRSPTVRSRAGPSTLPRSIRPRRRTPAAARMSLYAHSCFSERPVARDDIGKACHPPMIRTACPIHRDASVEPKLAVHGAPLRSEEHTSELQSLMRISYAVFCLKKKKNLESKQS